MTEGSISAAVAAALDDATLEIQDGAARALAVQYAALMDEAAPRATYAAALKVLAAAVAGKSPAVEKAFATVSTALAAHTVASDLGPKLLTTLLALGMAPGGRGVVKGGGDSAPVAGKVDELVKRREQRQAARR